MSAGRVAVGLASLLAPGVALAHSPFKGLDNFYAGLLHPLFVPAHLLTILALGVLFGQRGPKELQAAIATFLGAAALGLLGTLSGAGLDVGLPLLLGAAATGILVTLDTRLPTPVYVALAAVLGLLLGLDSAQGQLAGRGQLAALLGTALGVYALLLYALLFAEFFGRRAWQRIGLRVLGSWAAASALLVLSLSLAG
jgi:urease accessory protein